jgi:hypothetical protein
MRQFLPDPHQLDDTKTMLALALLVAAASFMKGRKGD